jgi:diamine N-acetyltransferase
MINLKGEHISLRALEPEDLDFLFQVENDETFWELSNTQTPFSKYILKQYIENANQDIYEIKQFRFVICNNENTQIGMIDLFEFDPKNKRIGVGLLILNKFQNQGLGSEALKLIINYAFESLNVHQIFANISSNNKNSISLFKKFNFAEVGVKKDWNFNNNKYQDEILFQLIKE